MSQKNKKQFGVYGNIKLFESKQIRNQWNAAAEK